MASDEEAVKLELEQKKTKEGGFICREIKRDKSRRQNHVYSPSKRITVGALFFLRIYTVMTKQKGKKGGEPKATWLKMECGLKAWLLKHQVTCYDFK